MPDRLLSQSTTLLSAVSPANRPPKATDDTNRGYAVGSHWLHSTRLFVAAAVTAAAALWMPLEDDNALPLDVVSGWQTAFGTTRLRAAHTGALIQVARSSDGATLDVGQVGYDLDIAAMDAFGQGTSLFLVQAYDQTGGTAHWTPPESAQRPRVYFATIGHKRVVTFDGIVNGTITYQSLACPNTVSVARNAHSAFTVIRQASSTRVCGVYGLDLTGATTNTNEKFNFKTSSPTESEYSVFNGGTNVTSGLVPITDAAVLSVVSGTSALKIRQNDDVATLAAASAQACPGAIFGRIYRTTYPGRFDALCFMINGTALSDADELKVRRSLYRLARIMPQAEIQIVDDGDSITEGTGATALVNRLQQVKRGLGLHVRTHNTAYHGQTAAGCLAGFPTRAAKAINPKARLSIYSLLVGINSLRANVSAVDVFATIRQIVALAKTAGYHRIELGTVLPDGTITAAQEAERVALNTMIRDGVAAGYWDVVTDYAADPIMGAAAAPSDTLLFSPDKIHPTSYGYGLMAGVRLRTLAALIGFVLEHRT